MRTTTQLPEPSRKHATCAWCAAQHATVIELIDHVDEQHLSDKRNLDSAPWTPSRDELAAILAEIRPIIDRFAARDHRRLAFCAAGSGN